MTMEAWRKLMPNNVTALPNKILAEMVERPGGYRTLASGILLADKDNDTSGIRPRWFRVHSVGEGIDWIKEEQYVYVEHGRWSQGLKVNDELKLHLLDNKDCLMVSDEHPLEEQL